MNDNNQVEIQLLSIKIPNASEYLEKNSESQGVIQIMLKRKDGGSGLESVSFAIQEEVEFDNKIITYRNMNALSDSIDIILLINGKRIYSENTPGSYFEIKLKNYQQRDTNIDLEVPLGKDIKIHVYLKIINLLGSLSQSFKERLKMFSQKKETTPGPIPEPIVIKKFVAEPEKKPEKKPEVEEPKEEEQKPLEDNQEEQKNEEKEEEPKEEQEEKEEKNEEVEKNNDEGENVEENQEKEKEEEKPIEGEEEVNNNENVENQEENEPNQEEPKQEEEQKEEQEEQKEEEKEEQEKEEKPQEEEPKEEQENKGEQKEEPKEEEQKEEPKEKENKEEENQEQKEEEQPKEEEQKEEPKEEEQKEEPKEEEQKEEPKEKENKEEPIEEKKEEPKEEKKEEPKKEEEAPLRSSIMERISKMGIKQGKKEDNKNTINPPSSTVKPGKLKMPDFLKKQNTSSPQDEPPKPVVQEDQKPSPEQPSTSEEPSHEPPSESSEKPKPSPSPVSSSTTGPKPVIPARPPKSVIPARPPKATVPLRPSKTTAPPAVPSPSPSTTEPPKESPSTTSSTITKSSTITPTPTSTINEANPEKSEEKIEENDDFIVIDKNEEGEIEARKLTPNAKNEIFLDSTDYDSFLADLKKKGKKHSDRETFCEGFFIASFPFKSGSVIEKSESFPSPCGHDECSILPAMKPEIIVRYPLQDTKNLELNNLAATICFPTGIKVCYSEEEEPHNVKDYVTPITNQKGERYYMMTYHFYWKMECNDYSKRYEMHPLKHHLMKFADSYLSQEEISEEETEAIQNDLERCQELGSRDFLYVPFCLSLISKYPYVQEMNKALISIYNLLLDEKETLLANDLLMYLIHSIPIPEHNTRIKFYLPYHQNYIDIECPKLDDISLMPANATYLLEKFSIDNIIYIFRLLISEKKILFIDKDYECLSKVTDGFISLLYPFQWIHTYIPIMSDQMLKYLETFLPFLNGINISLMPLVAEIFSEGEIEDSGEIFLIYIEEDKIRLSSSLNQEANAKKVKIEKFIQDNVPALPEKLEKELKNKLKKIKGEVDALVKAFQKKKKIDFVKQRQYLELDTRDAFIDLFVEMFHDYSKYLCLLDDDVVFNKNLFLNTVSSNDTDFFNEILDTQLFQQFTQNVVKEDINYFNNKCNLYEKGEKPKPPTTILSRDLKNEKNYCITPEFMDIRENDTASIDKIFLKKYPPPPKKKGKDAKKELRRIVENIKQVDDQEYENKKCFLYITPEQREAEKKKDEAKKQEEKEKKEGKKKIMGTGKILERMKKMNLQIAPHVSTVKKEGLTEKEKDSVKELIKDFVVKIFRSEEITEEQKNEKYKADLLNNINTPFGREFFISLLNKNVNTVILLQPTSFSFLGNLIYNCLIYTLSIKETGKLLEETVQLIKCTKYFGMEENGEKKRIFDHYKKKIQEIPKIMQMNFWENWYEVELKGVEKKTDKVKRDIIIGICDSLLELEITKSFVKNTVEKIAQKEFDKESDIYKEIKSIYIKKICQAKYVSVAREKK